jgi:flavin-dependent dehydrogenase
MTQNVEIAGAGPAGLSAALSLARKGVRARVLERAPGVGSRFAGDFQGLENWTGDTDILEELAGLGIEAAFDHKAFRDCVVFGPDGREHFYRSRRPLFYLIRRGPDPGSLDRALEKQARAAGVETEFGTARSHLPRGGIAAHGPRRADAVAVGYLFETDMPDGAFAAVSDDLAPKGYAYLLVWNGGATLATCLFDDFHGERSYLAKTLEFFRERVGLRMRSPRRFGGFGSLFPERRPSRGNVLLAGEAGGFQDALFGFGLHYALLSGHLAARALLDGGVDTYERLCRARLGGLLNQAVVNRAFYQKLGNGGYARFLHNADRVSDVGEWLGRLYRPSRWTSLLYPRARLQLDLAGKNLRPCVEDCTCTWCRCHGSKDRLEEAAACAEDRRAMSVSG